MRLTQSHANDPVLTLIAALHPATIGARLHWTKHRTPMGHRHAHSTPMVMLISRTPNSDNSSTRSARTTSQSTWDRPPRSLPRTPHTALSLSNSATELFHYRTTGTSNCAPARAAAQSRHTTRLGSVMEDRFRARKVAAQAAPAPFWTRIPAIATYPLRGSALYALIALTLCSALLVLPGILKLVVLGVLGMATYTYAFDILRHSANGEHDAPRLGYNSFDSAVLRLILLAFALGIVIVAAGVIAGKPGLTVAYLAVQLLLPGMMIALAIDGSLRRALNPAVSIDMALRIGWPYLAAYGLLYVIQGSGTAAIFVALKYLPPVVRELTIVVASIWSLFASFHLMGYLVYQYHEELGYEPSRGIALQREDPDQRLLDEAEQFVRDGHSDEAFQALRGALACGEPGGA
ncbi:conserved hypothetical protein [Xanthomonas campestris pv. campestris str. 8004]|uniref:DUF4013 domain-containing protein n=2 Tax=Xanthomonas campestris pv. campestris TaxID=340 RepID=Q8P7Q1_XANCP|nr:conserved hypothetical protein [Xanthomonas campestris pv. campestris str. ATCC 33913]AAY48624.1 conserved hypothetical protein [Xanthomonas campestris pv. campestris str. 8004]